MTSLSKRIMAAAVVVVFGMAGMIGLANCGEDAPSSNQQNVSLVTEQAKAQSLTIANDENRLESSYTSKIV